MKTIRTNAAQILQEQYKNYVRERKEYLGDESEPCTIQEWGESESHSDPDFYRWLFNDSDISDFGSSLMEEELKVAKEFIINL